MKYVSGELVFAYGSNLSVAQMAQRCPSWEYVARAELPGHELVFAGYSPRWDGAVATFIESPRRRVRGIVYSVHVRDLQRLDSFEGVPRVYDRRRVLVRVAERLLPVHTYQLVGFDLLGVPSPAYVAVVAGAYRAWGFDRRHLVRAVRAAAEVEAV
jgi:gamma-glutamylcyclotransferase (GGCT)/AIG2-like uncharacterized protein YtfP